MTSPDCSRCVHESARAYTPEPPEDRALLPSPEAAAELLIVMIGRRDREACAAVMLDIHHRIITDVLVSLGSHDHTFMSPREIYRDALLANAAAVIVAHNHPSGDTSPSRDDVAVTTRLARAGQIVGVDLLDHLVIAGSRWQSMARLGHI